MSALEFMVLAGISIAAVFAIVLWSDSVQRCMVSSAICHPVVPEVAEYVVSAMADDLVIAGAHGAISRGKENLAGSGNGRAIH